MNRIRLICILPGLAAGVMSCAEPKNHPFAAGGTASPPARKAEPAQKPEPDARPAPVTPGKVTRIALGDLFPLQQTRAVLLYDVRPAFHHSLGHIPGSVNWPKSAYQKQLTSREEEIRAAAAAGRPVVLYCTDLACPDARTVASLLAARGHSVRVLEGGWEAWKAGGLPAE